MSKKENKSENVPDGFLPIELIELNFTPVSHTASNSELFLFLDTDRGEVEGFAERFDRTVGGELIEKNNIIYLDTKLNFLNSVTHFKII